MTNNWKQLNPLSPGKSDIWQYFFDEFEIWISHIGYQEFPISNFDPWTRTSWIHQESKIWSSNIRYEPILIKTNPKATNSILKCQNTAKITQFNKKKPGLDPGWLQEYFFLPDSFSSLLDLWLKKTEQTNLDISCFFNGSNDLSLIGQLKLPHRRYNNIHLLYSLYQALMII